MPRDRSDSAIRPVSVTPGFHTMAEGSVLYRCGNTVVLCTASVDNEVPKWMSDNGGGWLTAEYQMHPRSNPKKRERRDGRGRAPGGRTMEIQRLVGRSLRAALDLKALGRRTITVDCDVLEADGGTRTASITGGFIAVALALHNLGLARVIQDQVAAISCGIVADKLLVDLAYEEDSTARVDMNVVGTLTGTIVEVQGTAEGRAIERSRYDELVTASLEAIKALCAEQKTAIEAGGASLAILMKAS